MDILAALAKSKLEEEEKGSLLTETNGKYMHFTVFKSSLERLGCDAETVEDCLFEPPEKWEWLLQYFEEKNNG